MADVVAPARGEARQTNPLMAPSELQAQLAKHYGIDATVLTPLGGETDQNMRAVAANGTQWFVRVTAASAEDLTWQTELLEHLKSTAADLPVPRIKRSVTDQLWHEVDADASNHPKTLRVMSWLPGRMLADVQHHPDELLEHIGTTAGRLCAALSSMPPPRDHVTHDWDMREAQRVVSAARDAIAEPDNRAHIDIAMRWYDDIADTLVDLPHGVVHHDLNDANILVDLDASGDLTVSGVVDVGDALHSARVTELAIAVAYAMVKKDDPLAAAAAVVKGFHAVLPLTSQELRAIYPLALARLCMNAATWNLRIQKTGNPYGRSRMHDTWPTLAKAVTIHPESAEETFRLACGLAPADDHLRTSRAMTDVATTSVFEHTVVPVHLDLQPSSDLLDGQDWTSPNDVAEVVRIARNGDPNRVLYLAHLRASMLRAAPRAPGLRGPATLQLGTSVLLPAGTSVAVPLDTVVEATRDDGALVLRHQVDGHEYRTIWHGLSSACSAGTHLDAGTRFAEIATPTEHGTAAGQHLLGSGLQVQVATSRDLALSLPRFVRPAERETWRRVSPDPHRLLGIPAGPETPNISSVLAARRMHLASSQRNYYRAPMNLVRGRDVWFYDEDGLGYLDSLNNVTHVGHAEPRVSRAAYSQLRKLNTNSRFVYPQIAEFTQRLVATMPSPLEVVFLVCSGSEANDLALRIARQVTGRHDVVNIDGAYHGNTGWVTGISPNRYKGPGGQGAPPSTHEVTIPDRYRGAYGYEDTDAGLKYGALARSVIERINGDGRAPAAFIAESLMGTAGNIVHPPGYLATAFDAARAAGALCISDEVQVGVGRLGPWWGFQLQGVVPDIVTMGKPLGNGHPIAALVTTRAIADAFDTGMKYFNTFGGNPVSCAIGSAVLDIVEGDGLRENAVSVGAYFADQLRSLAARHPIIGDVRAEGLYLGVELVRDRETKEPATHEAFLVTELTKERGVVVFPNGVYDNVLKIKPPMTFTRRDVDMYVDVLDEVLPIVGAMYSPIATSSPRS
jgi:4-aminobutyrate aminotransferase-like enzyme/Ser/Thr protein kinase RdoA (MazF antagonist)